jgi:hypothetical protein
MSGRRAYRHSTRFSVTRLFPRHKARNAPRNQLISCPSGRYKDPIVGESQTVDIRCQLNKDLSS